MLLYASGVEKPPFLGPKSLKMLFFRTNDLEALPISRNQYMNGFLRSIRILWYHYHAKLFNQNVDKTIKSDCVKLNEFEK